MNVNCTSDNVVCQQQEDWINGYPVTVLRDSGCSGVVGKRKSADKEQHTGKKGCILFIDNTHRERQYSTIKLNTPYLKAKIEALRSENVIQDRILSVLCQRALADSDMKLTPDNICRNQRERKSDNDSNLL